jgi:hypothetical protein
MQAQHGQTPATETRPASLITCAWPRRAQDMTSARHHENMQHPFRIRPTNRQPYQGASRSHTKTNAAVHALTAEPDEPRKRPPETCTYGSHRGTMPQPKQLLPCCAPASLDARGQLAHLFAQVVHLLRLPSCIQQEVGCVFNHITPAAEVHFQGCRIGKQNQETDAHTHNSKTHSSPNVCPTASWQPTLLDHEPAITLTEQRQQTTYSIQTRRALRGNRKENRKRGEARTTAPHQQETKSLAVGPAAASCNPGCSRADERQQRPPSKTSATSKQPQTHRHTTHTGERTHTHNTHAHTHTTCPRTCSQGARPSINARNLKPDLSGKQSQHIFATTRPPRII